MDTQGYRAWPNVHDAQRLDTKRIRRELLPFALGLASGTVAVTSASPNPQRFPAWATIRVWMEDGLSVLKNDTSI
jgi:hypothetical protein